MKKIIFVFSVIALVSSYAHAGNVDTYGIGSKAAAMGGAYSAHADDPYAVYYNPAGLTLIEKKIFSAGVHISDPTIEVENLRVSNTDDPTIAGPKNLDNEQRYLYCPHAGYAMPLSDELALGVALYVPWGLKLTYSENPSENPGSYNSSHSEYSRIAITPTVAYKVRDNLSVGFGVSVGKSVGRNQNNLYISPDLGRDPVIGPTLAAQATAMATQSIQSVQAQNPGIVPEIKTSTAAYNFLNAVANNPSTDAVTAATAAAGAAQFRSYANGGAETPEQIGTYTAAQLNGVPAVDHNAEMNFDSEDSANYSYNLGVMYQPVDSISLGFTYRSRTSTDFEGEATKNGEYVTDFNLKYDHPEQVQFGARYVPESCRDFSIEFDMVWTRWSILEHQTAYFDTPITFQIVPGMPESDKQISSVTQARNWEDTKQVKIGAEYKATELVTLRVGYFYDPSPVPDDTLDLVWSDADKKTYSIGAGFDLGSTNQAFLKGVTVDTVLQYTDIEKARYIGGESSNLNHSYDITNTYGRKVSFNADGNIWSVGFTVNYKF